MTHPLGIKCFCMLKIILNLYHSISYISHCCDKITDQSNLRSGGFSLSWFEGTGHHGRGGVTAGTGAGSRCHIACRARRKRELHFSFWFSLIPQPIMLSIFIVGLPTSNNLIMIIHHSHVQRFTFMVILYAFQWTSKISHHSYKCFKIYI